MSERRMRSRAVTITTVSVISVSLVTAGLIYAAVPEDSTADCVTGPDRGGEYTVLPDSECEDGSSYRRTSSAQNPTGGSVFWYYNAAHRNGNKIKGGTTLTPKSGAIKTSSGATIRKGGFGGSGSGGS